MPERWAVNASPLILLAKVSQSDLLPRLAAELVIPSGVAQELRAKPAEDAARRWLVRVGQKFVRQLRAADPEIAAWDLGRGETEVLSWARQHPGFCAIVDDMAARNCAEALGIPARGTLGIVILAKKRGLLPQAKPVFDALLGAGYYLSPAVLRHALSLAGEAK